MTEPLYEYTRGQGWGLSLPGKPARCRGKEMLMFHRKPEVGEYYFNIGVYHQFDGPYWVNKDGTPNWKLFIKHASDYGWYLEKPGFGAHHEGYPLPDNNFIVVKYV